MSTLRALIAVLALGLFACGSSDEGNEPDADTSGADAANAPDGAGAIDAAPPDAVQNPGHTENNGGVWHRPGKEDPLTNCVSCHGADLTGGEGPSCYNCHNNDDHTINRGGHMHKSGSSSTCTTCHGPNNTGGLGPACSECH